MVCVGRAGGIDVGRVVGFAIERVTRTRRKIGGIRRMWFDVTLRRTGTPDFKRATMGRRSNCMFGDTVGAGAGRSEVRRQPEVWGVHWSGDFCLRVGAPRGGRRHLTCGGTATRWRERWRRGVITVFVHTDHDRLCRRRVLVVRTMPY